MANEERRQMLLNRVRKNRKRLKAWLKREKISCYRLYDRDIPEIPLVIDNYEGHLHVAEFARRGKEGEELEERGEFWAREMVEPLARELGIPERHVYYKERSRQRGQGQYQARGSGENRIQVKEDGLKFWVNLRDYLDTGLFLDHRRTRALVAEESENKALLNLFCYTAAFSVHAAAAGAANTLSIDLSGTYLEWARENFESNGLERGRNRLVRADVMEELLEMAGTGQTFDIAIVDPPTFSNSKRMEDVFDVQRDHVELLRRTHRLMTRQGVVYFSTNHRRFKFAEDEISELFDAEEISKKTLPFDFRDQKIHRSWRLKMRS